MRITCCFFFQNDAIYCIDLPIGLDKLHSLIFFQGVMALYKGVQNDFAISCIRKAVEVLLSENTTLPLYVSTFMFFCPSYRLSYTSPMR